MNRLTCARRLPEVFGCLVFVVIGAFSFHCNAAEQEQRTRFQEVTPRSHSFRETALLVLGLYSVNVLGYYLINKDEIEQNATLQKYLTNLSKSTNFDNDRPTVNWGIHVYTGSLLYQTFRARSYSKTDAFLLTTLQSALFELTIEIVEEPSSVEDLVNTPVFGSLLGRGLELGSFPLLNSDSGFLRILGHLMNPPTLLGSFYEGRTTVTVAPMVGKINGISLQARF
jgi:hypothetical protein